MDPSVQQEPIVNKTEKQSLNILSILLPLFTLLVGLGLGLFTSRIIFKTSPQPTPQPPTAPQIAKADLPISPDILKNPIVYEWRGSVNGKVIAKDEHTLTIEDEKGNKITTTDLLPNGSGTFKTTYFNLKKGSRPTALTLKDIAIGTTLRGDFFVFKNFPDTPIGNQFVIEE